MKRSDWTYRYLLRVMDHAAKIKSILGVESQKLKELSMVTAIPAYAEPVPERGTYISKPLKQ